MKTKLHFFTLKFKFILLTLVAAAVMGCSKNNTDVKATDIPPPATVQKAADLKCVNVYYDKSTNPNFKLGKTYALMLVNLLGHFPGYQQHLSSVESYKKGALNTCDANFYIGSFFDNKLPADFISDYRSTTKLVTWIGYNFWQLGPDFETYFGYQNYSFTTLDTVNKTPPPDSKPSFFRDIIYKGETFTKYNEWDTVSPTTLVAAFEQAKLTNKTSSVATVLAEAKHSFTNEIIPWALQNKNRFYIAEIPFSYAHEADRYLIFADLLFDCMGAQPLGTAKKAVIRLTDVNPMSQQSWLDEARGILKAQGVTPHISLQPIFNDPTYAIAGHAGNPEVRIEQSMTLLSRIQQYAAEGSVFIWHGNSFEYNNTGSGDNEFWNSVTNTPIAGDSPAYVLGRLDNGFASFAALKITPKIFETPHYHASVLDNFMFGQIFNWSIGRGIYVESTASGAFKAEAGKPLNYEIGNTVNAQNRINKFNGFSATATAGYAEVGQLFPYEIYGDIYQQQMLPENLGGVILGKRTADQILADAKRNLVLRDNWASVYYQPYLLDPAVNTDNSSTTQPKDLQRIVAGLKALGYTFVNLNDYTSSNPNKKSPPRIEVQ